MLSDSHFLFTLEDTTNCPIKKFTLYDGSEKIEGNQVKVAKLDALNYLEDGVISIQTNYTAENNEI